MVFKFIVYFVIVWFQLCWKYSDWVWPFNEFGKVLFNTLIFVFAWIEYNILK